MLLGHGVVNGDKMLIFHILYGDHVVFIGFFRFQGGQGNAAAADQGVARGVDGIAADGADIEFAPQKVGGNIPVLDGLAVHQLDNGDPQSLGQGLEQGNIR